MRRARLGELLGAAGSIKTGPFGTALRASEYSESGRPVISVGEIGNGRLRVFAKTPRVGAATVARLPEYTLMPGDVVFARKGAVDRSATVQPDESDYFLGSDGIRLRLGPDVSAAFVGYQFQSPRLREWLLRHASGSTMPSLNQSILAQAPIDIPTLGEQRAIAEVLGALDDKIAANDRIVATSDQLAEARLLAATGSVKRILQDTATITMGSSPPGTSYNEIGEGLPFYQGVRDFGARSPSRRIWTTEPVRTADPGDTLLSVRAPVGRTNLAAESCCIGRGLAAVTSRDGRPWTLYYALRVSKAWAPYEAEGTVFGSINKAQLAAVEIPMVAASDRTRLEATLAALGRHSESLLAEIEQLTSLRDTLLPALMSGRLSVSTAAEAVEAATGNGNAPSLTDPPKR